MWHQVTKVVAKRYNLHELFIHPNQLMWPDFATDSMTQKCSLIIYICLNVYYLSTKISIYYIYIVFIKFNLYHINICHHIG
jgi:hypothetical protein